MKVIAAINGTITSESMAFYALNYAKVQNFTLVLLHVENQKDDMADVQASIKRITTIAVSKNVQVESVILKEPFRVAIKNYLSSVRPDIIFCSTRKKKKFLASSFSEALTKMNIDTDIAVVRIVKMSHIMDLNTMMLSIKEDRLSVKKFAFFAALACAYEANAEIFSLSAVSKSKFSTIDIGATKERLRAINYNLRHYIKLSRFMPFSLHIKHDFTNNEADSVLAHIVKSNSKLVVIGAKKLSVGSLFNKDMLLEKLLSESSVNIIAYYTKES